MANRRKFVKRSPVASSILGHKRSAQRHYKEWERNSGNYPALRRYAYHTVAADLQKRENRIMMSEKRYLFDSLSKKIK